MKCKIFIGPYQTTQDEINRWLDEGNIRIINILQSQSDMYWVTITFFYEDMR